MATPYCLDALPPLGDSAVCCLPDMGILNDDLFAKVARWRSAWRQQPIEMMETCSSELSDLNHALIRDRKLPKSALDLMEKFAETGYLYILRTLVLILVHSNQQLFCLSQLQQALFLFLPSSRLFRFSLPY